MAGLYSGREAEQILNLSVSPGNPCAGITLLSALVELFLDHVQKFQGTSGLTMSGVVHDAGKVKTAAALLADTRYVNPVVQLGA